MAKCFAPHLHELISPNQSAFIKCRQIHDNFRYVLGVAKMLARRKLPRIMFKIDLAKVFDSVNWVFLIELLSAIGCRRTWTNWISTILATSSTKILLNGVLGRRICHGRGLRQGDPLLPMLFVLVMECFQAMINTVDDHGMFEPLGRDSIKFRVSLYADDVVAFFSPITKYLFMIKEILSLFEKATGLAANYDKSQVFLIHCSDEHICLV